MLDINKTVLDWLFEREFYLESSALQWIWYGTPGHFIGGKHCLFLFHLATELPNGILVSSVGEYRLPGRHQRQEVGLDRYFETYVFCITDERCSASDCGCNMPEIVPSEIDSLGSNSSGECQRDHYELCTKWSLRTRESIDRIKEEIVAAQAPSGDA